MANLENIDWSKYAGWDLPVYLNRLNPVPLDKTSIFDSLSAATAYAADETKMAYAGQILSVVEGGKVVVYKVNEDRTLEKVGIGAGSITAENYTAAIGLITSGSATLGQIVYIINEEVKEGKTYPAGTYVVSAVGSSPALSHLTSEAAGASGLTSRVEGLEAWEGVAKSQISALQDSAHTHANITELDKIADGDKAKWDEAYASAHSHANKDVLDGITTEKVTAWDAAEANAKAYASAYTEIAMASETARTEAAYDVKGAAASAETAAKNYTDNAIAVETARTEAAYDAKGAADTAEANAKAYASAYTEIAMASETARTEAAYDVKGAAASAETAAKNYADNAVVAFSGNVVTELANVNAKFDNYATSADTVAAIDAAKTASVVTVEKLATAESGFASTYVVKQNGTQVGASINIPKDYLVKSGEVKVCTEDDKPVVGYKKGDKYLDFIVNTKDGSGNEQHIYILVKDLVDVYKGSEYIEVSSANVISVKYESLSGKLYTDLAIASLATKEEVNTLSGNVVTAIKAVDDKFANYATSADTVAAIKAVDDKFANYATSANTVAAIKAVDDKFANYATSADTVAAIKAVDTKVDNLSGSVVAVEARVATAEADIDALELKVGDSAVSVQISNAIDAYSGVVKTELAKKVDVETGKRLMTDAEGTKLAGIAEGAQVNVIESVNVNGVDATISGKNASVVVDATKIAVGKDITVSGETISATTKVDSVLQGIFDRLNGIQVSALTEVVASESGITVTEKNKVSLKLETATVDTIKEGHIEIKVNDNGQLFGQMYYIEGESE